MTSGWGVVPLRSAVCALSVAEGLGVGRRNDERVSRDTTVMHSLYLYQCAWYGYFFWGVKSKHRHHHPHNWDLEDKSEKSLKPWEGNL